MLPNNSLMQKPLRGSAGSCHRSTRHDPEDMHVNTQHVGSIVYWDEPDGHAWEILTVSYARQASNSGPKDAA
ncbi:MAG: hypothetical protein ACMG5Z_03080 [Luteimonas sp.]